jgi:hypothetical protein
MAHACNCNRVHGGFTSFVYAFPAMPYSFSVILRIIHVCLSAPIDATTSKPHAMIPYTLLSSKPDTNSPSFLAFLMRCCRMTLLDVLVRAYCREAFHAHHTHKHTHTTGVASDSAWCAVIVSHALLMYWLVHYKTGSLLTWVSIAISQPCALNLYLDLVPYTP